MRRWLNEFGANKCEGQYVSDHLISAPGMGLALLANRSDVLDQLRRYGLAAANTDGSSPENAFKHALYAALNYCSIGAQPADAMANFREVRDGINMNKNNGEWFTDDFNNHQGFKLAKRINCSSRVDLIAAVLSAYENGHLHDINGNPTKKK